MTEEDQPVDFASGQHLGILVLDLGIVPRIPHDHRIAGIARRLFRATNDAGEERIGDIRNRQQDLRRTQRAQGACRDVGGVAQRADHFEHAQAGRFGDSLGSTEDTRDRGSRNPGPRGYVDNGRHRTVMDRVAAHVDDDPM
jgi:hypothetical protein